IAAGRLQRIGNVEDHLGVEDLVLYQLLLGVGEDGHVVPRILPTFSQLSGLGRVAGHHRRAELAGLRHRRNGGDRTMAQHCGWLLLCMKMAEYLAEVGILHQSTTGAWPPGTKTPA